MKFVRYEHDGRAHDAVMSAGRVHDLPDGLTVDGLIERGLPAALDIGARAVESGGVDAQSVRLLAPLHPRTIRDFVAFEEHVEGVRKSIDGAADVPEAWFDAPTFYFTNPNAVLGPDEPVTVPAGCQALDFELEVAVVVGAEGRDLSAAAASDHVFGYTILNDWSARDLQRREMQVGLGPAKGKDFASTLGPWIVTADELEGHRDAEGFLDLRCTASINGEEVGSDLLSNMGWTFETMIAYASRNTRVVPGDVLGSGTVGNGGCLAELWGRRGRQDPPPLKPGDVVELQVEGIGTVRNEVVAGQASPVALPTVRRRDVARARGSA